MYVKFQVQQSIYLIPVQLSHLLVVQQNKWRKLYSKFKTSGNGISSFLCYTNRGLDGGGGGYIAPLCGSHLLLFAILFPNQPLYATDDSLESHLTRILFL